MLLRISSQQINRLLFGVGVILLILLLVQTTSADKNTAEAAERTEIASPPPPPPPPPIDQPAQKMNEDLDEILKILDDHGVAE